MVYHFLMKYQSPIWHLIQKQVQYQVSTQVLQHRNLMFYNSFFYLVYQFCIMELNVKEFLDFTRKLQVLALMVPPIQQSYMVIFYGELEKLILRYPQILFMNMILDQGLPHLLKLGCLSFGSKSQIYIMAAYMIGTLTMCKLLDQEYYLYPLSPNLFLFLYPSNTMNQTSNSDYQSYQYYIRLVLDYEF